MYCIRKITAVILVGLLIVSVMSIVNVGAKTSDPTTSESSIELRIQESIGNAISWLETDQAQDGSWSGDLGITSLLTLALINAGYSEDDTMVANAIDYINEYVQLDGSIAAAPTYSNYYTSVSILALSATTNPDYESTVNNAVQFIMESQLKTPNEDIDADWVGGFGYGGAKHAGRPDISNTQFAIMALHSAAANFDDIDVPDTVWDSTIEFLTKCQNLVETNPLASDKNSPSYNDGGFVYYPGFSKAGEDISYGSSTSAGVWSMFLCGLDGDDQRIAEGLNWLNNHYTWDINPNLEEKGLFNYYWGAARANLFSKKSIVIDLEANHHNWYEELAEKLMELQSPDGYWVNEKSDWFWEDIPELATAYTLLAFETQLLSAFDQSATDMELEIELEGQAGDLHVYDNRGGHIGQNYKTGDLENTITQGNGKFTSSSEYQTIKLADVKAGGYYINILGKQTDDFNLKISGIKDSQLASEFSFEGELTEAESKGTSVMVTSVEKPLTLFTAEPKSIPILDLNTEKITVEPGKTITVQLELEELGGAEDLKDVSLSCTLKPTETASETVFDINNFDLKAGESKVVICTLEVPSEFDSENNDEYILIESSNAHPVKVQLKFDTNEDEKDIISEISINTMLLVTAAGMGALLIIVFISIGKDKRKRK